MREEELVGVDNGAPRAADAPGLGERAAGEAAEDVEERSMESNEGADRSTESDEGAIDEVA